MSGEIWRWDAGQVAAAIRDREISARDAVTSCLSRLDEVNGKINAVTVVLREEAIKDADDADRRLRAGEATGALHGVPISIKENVDQKDLTVPNGVVAFKDNVATEDNPVVSNLKKSGAIVIGRTNTPAFSLRWHTDNDLRGPTLNPWHRDYTPGGSSGGAAASVAAGITPLAQGNDYGGSIRYPAHCCGIAGLRPTPGRIPSLNASAPEERPMTFQLFSVQGPFARTVSDLRLALGAMATEDLRDPWWTPAPLTGPPLQSPIRVAMIVDPANHGVDPEVAQGIRQAGEALSAAGYIVEETELPDSGEAGNAFRRLAWTEMRHFLEPKMRELGGKDIGRILDLRLSTIPVLGLTEYMKDFALRAKCILQWSRFMVKYPIVIGPVSTQPAFKVGADLDVAVAEELINSQRLLLSIGLLGLPSVSVPVTLSHLGLPIGVQVVSRRFREDLALDAAQVIEACHGVKTPIDVQW